MDQVTTSDLLSLVLAQRANIDLQFQFWLTITFAVIVASFSAGDRLNGRLRMFAAVLYFLATVHLATRWTFDGMVGARWVAVLAARGVDIGIPWFAVYTRVALMAIGSVAAIALLIRSPWHRGERP
jgi:hypothetical protein